MSANIAQEDVQQQLTRCHHDGVDHRIRVLVATVMNYPIGLFKSINWEGFDYAQNKDPYQLLGYVQAEYARLMCRRHNHQGKSCCLYKPALSVTSAGPSTETPSPCQLERLRNVLRNGLAEAVETQMTRVDIGKVLSFTRDKYGEIDWEGFNLDEDRDPLELLGYLQGESERFLKPKKRRRSKSEDLYDEPSGVRFGNVRKVLRRCLTHDTATRTRRSVGTVLSFVKDNFDQIQWANIAEDMEDPKMLLGSLKGEQRSLQQRQEESSADLWTQVGTLRRQPEARMTGAVVEALYQLYHKKAAKGYHVDLQKREGAIDDATCGDLGGRIQWAVRKDAVEQAVITVMKMFMIWKLGRHLSYDEFSEGTMRLVMIGAPGTGKTAQAERLLHDVLSELKNNSELVPQDLHQERDELISMLEAAIKNRLHYRIDMQLCGMTPYEQFDDVNYLPARIRTDRSLPLRALYAVCRDNEAQTFADFLKDLLQSPMVSQVALLLAFLEMKHVLKFMRATLLEENNDKHMFVQFTMDEFQHGIEPEAELQVKGGHAMFACDLTSAQGRQHADSDDFALFIVSGFGTHLDFKSRDTLSAIKISRSKHIPMKLLSDEQLANMLLNLATRLGLQGLPRQLLQDLVPWPGGNPRHLEKLLVSLAASEGAVDMQKRQAVSRQGLIQALTSAQALPLNTVLPLALELVCSERHTTVESLGRWMGYMQGVLFKKVVGLAITQKVVTRRAQIHPDAVWVNEECGEPAPGTTPTPLTVGLLEGIGPLALQQIGLDDEDYYVVLPPLVYHKWCNKAKTLKWLPGSDIPLLDETFKMYLTPSHTEYASVNVLIIKMYAMRHLLGEATCRLGWLVPTAAPHTAGLEIQLPTTHYNLVVDNDWTKPQDMHQALADWKAGGAWVYLGPGKEPRPRFWLLLKSVDGIDFIVHALLESHQYGGEMVDPVQLQADYLKDRALLPGYRHFFLFITGASEPEEALRLGDDMAVVALENHWRYNTWYGPWRRNKTMLLAIERPQHQLQTAALHQLVSSWEEAIGIATGE